MCKSKILLGLVALLLLLPGNLEAQDHNRQFIDISGDITGLTLRVAAVESDVFDLKQKMEKEIESLVGRLDKLESQPAPTPVAEVVKGNFPAPVNQAVKSGGSNGGSNGGSTGGSAGKYQKIPQSSNGPYANFPVSSGPHWTHPGTIENHLQSAHGINTSGMSREQMLSLHDSLHEGSQQRATTTTRTYSTSSYNSCPNGGNCPQSTSYTRRGIFGWRK